MDAVKETSADLLYNKLKELHFQTAQALYLPICNIADFDWTPQKIYDELSEDFPAHIAIPFPPKNASILLQIFYCRIYYAYLLYPYVESQQKSLLQFIELQFLTLTSDNIIDYHQQNPFIQNRINPKFQLLRLDFNSTVSYDSLLFNQKYSFGHNVHPSRNINYGNELLNFLNLNCETPVLMILRHTLLSFKCHQYNKILAGYMKGDSTVQKFLFIIIYQGMMNFYTNNHNEIPLQTRLSIHYHLYHKQNSSQLCMWVEQHLSLVRIWCFIYLCDQLKLVPLLYKYIQNNIPEWNHMFQWYNKQLVYVANEFVRHNKFPSLNPDDFPVTATYIIDNDMAILPRYHRLHCDHTVWDLYYYWASRKMHTFGISLLNDLPSYLGLNTVQKRNTLFAVLVNLYSCRYIYLNSDQCFIRQQKRAVAAKYTKFYEIEVADNCSKILLSQSNKSIKTFLAGNKRNEAYGHINSQVDIFDDIYSYTNNAKISRKRKNCKNIEQLKGINLNGVMIRLVGYKYELSKNKKFKGDERYIGGACILLLCPSCGSICVFSDQCWDSYGNYKCKYC